MLKKYIEKLKSNQSGFTLIELIIVITVLGVIVAAFLPRTGGNVEKTKQVMHENLLNTISSAIAEYGTENKLTASNGDNHKIKKGDKEIKVSENEGDTLLIPITAEHPLIKEGYLDKVPLNPWVSEKDFEKFKYIVDFKVTTRTVANPDGSSGNFAKLIPVVKLVEVDGDKVIRDKFVIVENGATKVASEDSKIINKELFGYDFEDDVELDESGEPVDFDDN